MSGRFSLTSTDGTFAHFSLSWRLQVEATQRPAEDGGPNHAGGSLGRWDCLHSRGADFLRKCLTAFEAFTEVTVNSKDGGTDDNNQWKSCKVCDSSWKEVQELKQMHVIMKMLYIVVETLNVSEGGCCMLRG